MKTVSFKLPEVLVRKLERAATERRQSKSDVIRSALEQFLDGEGRVYPGSFLEAAGNLVGCAEGPGDLSYNPKYMEDFGK
jgi:hypothetical protein